MEELYGAESVNERTQQIISDSYRQAFLSRMEKVARHIDNLFEDNPELIDVPNLSKIDANDLKNILEDRDKGYITGLSVELRGENSNEEVYNLSVRRRPNA